MTDDLHILLQLQDIDAAIDNFKSRIQMVETQIGAKTKELESLKSNLVSAKSTLQSHQAKKKELELAAEEKEKIVKKHQSELNSLKSNDAYKAMLVEITNAKAEVHKIEDQILETMEAIDKADKDYKAHEQKVKSQEASLRGEIQKFEGQKNGLNQESSAKQAERDTYAQTVPEKLRSIYDAIRVKRGTLAIVPMTGSNCSGCRMALTPNQANEVRKRKNIVRCENCSRIVYLPEDASAVSAAPATPAEKSPAAVDAVPAVTAPAGDAASSASANPPIAS